MYETDDLKAIEDKERILSNLVLRHQTWLKASLENQVAVVRLEDKAKEAEARAQSLEEAKNSRRGISCAKRFNNSNSLEREWRPRSKLHLQI